MLVNVASLTGGKEESKTASPGKTYDQTFYSLKAAGNMQRVTLK